MAIALITLGFLVLVVNSAYLAARADASVFYFGNLVLHMVLGLALAVAAAVRWGRQWRLWPRLLLAGGLLLAVAVVSGLALMVLGATRPHAWILKTHIGTATGGAALVFVWMATAAARRPTWRERRGAAAVVATAVAAVLVSVHAGEGHDRGAVAPGGQPFRA